MSAFAEHAEGVKAELAAAPGAPPLASFDPSIIIAIITALIGMFKDCNLTPAQAVKRAANPGFLDRLRLRRLVRQHVQGSGDDADALEAAVLDYGRQVKTPEMKAMFAEHGP